MNARQRWFAAIALALAVGLLFFSSFGDATAHAELVSSSPAAGGAESVAPTQIELRFSESVDLGLSSVSLVGSDGAPVELEQPVLDPADAHVLWVSLSRPATVPPGIYTVVWGAYSAEDGHASSGSFTFSIGTGEAPAQGTNGGVGVSSWSTAGKWLELIGSILLTGLAFFGMTGGDDLDHRVRSNRRVFVALIALAIAGAFISFRAREVDIAGGGMLAGIDRQVASDLLASTFGQMWAVRVCVLVVALAAVFPRKWSSAVLSVVLSAGMIAMGTIAISGHAAAVDRAWLAVTIDFAHMTGAAVWMGGLLALLMVLSPALNAPGDLELLRKQGNRFAGAVVVIVAAGITSAYWHVGGRRSLQSSDYGRTLLIKVGIVAALLGLAYYNRRVLQGARGRLPWVPIAIGAELVLALLILLFSSDLSQTPPGNQPLTVQIAARATNLSTQATTGSTTIGLSGVLTGDPTDEIAVSISPSTDLQRVIVHSTLLRASDGVTVSDRFDATPIENQPGSYRFPAGRLGIAGPWQLEITVRRAGVQDEIVTIPVDTSALATRGERAVEDRWGGFRLTSHTLLALGLAALMLVIGLGGLRRITGLEPLASGFLLAASLVIAGGFLVSAARGLLPVTPYRAQANPAVDTSPGALTYAGDLYQLNCAICHGADGRGAGTSNLAHLHGNAADLTGSRTVSQSDGDLRYWIASGVSGTRMPAFGAALTEDEQWQLVLLIRQLQEEARAAEENE